MKRGWIAGAVSLLLLMFGAPARADLALVTSIVTFDHAPSADDLDMLSGIALSAHGFRHVPAAVVTTLPGDVDNLDSLPAVRGVYPNTPMRTLLSGSTATIHADQAWASGITGNGVGVAVIDTGIDGTRADLCAAAAFCNGTPVRTVQNVKVLGRQELAEDPVVFVPDQINTDTSSGHGSHVAGIAGGAGVASATPGMYRGVAHGADLIGFGTGEAVEAANVLGAYDYAIEHRAQYNIRVINNSWGPGVGTPYDPEHPVNLATDAAWAAGISVVFGAGNDGPRTDSMNAFSVHPKAISVAGGTKGGDIAFFSSRGVPGSPLWHPTVTAPGYSIVSVRASTGFYGDVADVSGGTAGQVDAADAPYYAVATGTSMSSPHVAGVIALMQQAAHDARGVWLTPSQVRNIVQNTAVSRDASRGRGGLPNYQQYSMGAGYVDAKAAADAAAAGTNMGDYNQHVTTDVRPFKGEVGPAAYIPTQSFETIYPVGAGAISLDVMGEWATAANDVDIDLYNPAGARVLTTQLLCAPDAEPNGYSSFCTTLPSERLTVAAPTPGAWRAVVHGTFSVTDTVNGLWSVAYPDTTFATAAAPSSISVVADAASPSVSGQSVKLSATVRDAAGMPVLNAPVVWTSTGVGTIVHAETLTHASGGATAFATSGPAGTQTITVSSGSASGATSLTWLGVTPPNVVPNPTPAASTPGNASGGGWINDPNKRHLSFSAAYAAGATKPSGELSYDDKSGTKVAATSADVFNRSGSNATFRGPCTLNGASGYSCSVEVADVGEPGKGKDTFHLTVTRATDPTWRYETQGTLGGGNIHVKS